MSDILTKWEHPADYAGYSPIGDYVLLTKNRESCLLSISNFAVSLDSLRQIAEEGDETFYTFTARHWAVGWVEYLIINQSAPKELIDEAESINCALADYPVLSDEDYSEKQVQAMYDYWAEIRVGDRVDYCRDAGLSIFAARRDDDLPDEVMDHFRENEIFY